MAELKTTPNDGNVAAFIDSVSDPVRQSDARELCELMTEISGFEPVMWGDSIIGFGQQSLHYASGRELEWFIIGFSPRKAATTLYINEGFDDYDEVLTRLGKHSKTKSCLHIKRLDKIDSAALAELIATSVQRAYAPGSAS